VVVLVFFGGEIVEGRVVSLAVVERLDVLKDLAGEFAVCLPGVSSFSA
jgi:hypothetical protein